MWAMPIIVVNAVGANTGGAVTHLRAVLPRLSSYREFRFIVYLNAEIRDQLAEPTGHNVELHFVKLGSGFRRGLWDQLGLPRLAAMANAELILSLLNHGPARPRTRQVILQRNPTYFTRTQSRTGFEKIRTAIRRRMALAACKASQLVLTPSKATLRDLMSWLNHPNVQVLPHGIDTRWFSPSPDHLAALPSELAGAGQPRLVYVGHVAGYKGHADLLDAFSKIKREIPSASLALTFSRESPGPTGPREMILELAGRAEGIPDVYLVGSQPPVVVRALYEWSDIVVFPSRLESFGFPLIEALAMGKPVIASDAPPLVELGGGISLHYAAGDNDSLAQLVIALASDDRRRSEMTRQGRERALEYDWDTYVDRLIGFVNSVLR